MQGAAVHADPLYQSKHGCLRNRLIKTLVDSFSITDVRCARSSATKRSRQKIARRALLPRRVTVPDEEREEPMSVPKQKVFPRRQSAGVMTVMPQHAEHSHASSPYDGGSAKGSADVNATQLVSSTTQHRGSVVGAPRPPQATPKYDNDHFGSLRAGIVTLTTDSRGSSGSDRSVHTLCGTLGTRLLVPDFEFVGPDCSVGTGGKTMAAGMEVIVDECVR